MFLLQGLGDTYNIDVLVYIVIVLVFIGVIVYLLNWIFSSLKWPRPIKFAIQILISLFVFIWILSLFGFI